MIKFTSVFTLLIFSVNAFAQTNSESEVKNQHKLNCKFEQLEFDSRYETGRISACEQLGANKYLIISQAENRPINPSPWYGFSIKSSSEVKTTVQILVRAEKSRPRYLPKISIDKKNWTPLNFDIIDDDLVLQVDIGPKLPVQYVSAQEIIDTDFYQSWNEQIAKRSPFTQETIGSSVEGRPIDALIHKHADNKEWLLIVGRQHPPEITGALALLNFVEALISDNQKNKAFFNRFNILLVPLVNPDGVVDGNWRHNVNGIDLNRDWGKFTQAETRAVHNKLLKLMDKEQHLVFALDFHSTQQDIFYTIPSDYVPVVNKDKLNESTVMPATFVEEWLRDLNLMTLRSFSVRERPGTSPGRGVFKQFIADEYGVHAVTFEIGDNTNRALINHVATQSANTLVTKLLNTPATDFVAKTGQTLE